MTLNVCVLSSISTCTYTAQTNKMHIFQINTSIFKCWCLLHVSNPRVYLQEDIFICGYGIVCFTRISMNILVGREVCSMSDTHTWYTGLFKMIVEVLTTCHTQHTWDRSIYIFYLIEQHSKILLHTSQVLYMCTLCDSTNINTIIEFVPNCL